MTVTGGKHKPDILEGASRGARVAPEGGGMRRCGALGTLAMLAVLSACRASPRGEAPGGEAAREREGERSTSAASPQTERSVRTDQSARSLLSFLKPEPLKIPEGTVLPLSLETTVSSETAHVGDLVVAKLAQDVTSGEHVLLGAGTEVRGKVVAAVPAGHVKGRARLALAFDQVVVKDRQYPLEASGLDVTADPQHGRDAALVGGGAGAGALIGGIAKGGKGAAIGALIGAGAGTGAVLATKHKEVVFEAGARCNVHLTRVLTLD